MPFIINLFFLFALLPFISPIPYSSDVQPLAFILGALLIFNATIKDKIILTKIDIYLFVLAIISYIYINYQSEYLYENGVASANNSLRRQVGLTFVLIIYLATKNFIHALDFRILYFVIYIQTFFTILNIYFANIYNAIVSNFIRVIKIDFTTYEGYRGASGLTIEPAYLAGSAVAYLIIASYFWKKKKISNLVYLMAIIPCIFLIFVSKSALGVILLFLVSFYIFLEIIDLKKLILVLFSILSLYIFSPYINYTDIKYSNLIEENRGMRLLQKATDEGFSKIIRDKSFVDKFTPIYVGYLSLKENPIGNGIGSYPLAVIDNQEIIKKDLNACTRLDVMYDRSVIPTCVTKAPSAFGLYTTEFGFLFIFFLITLFFKQNNNFILSTFIKGIGLLFILTAFSITFPLIWIILALLSADDDRYKKMYNTEKET